MNPYKMAWYHPFDIGPEYEFCGFTRGGLATFEEIYMDWNPLWKTTRHTLTSKYMIRAGEA
jgi:hypothetical protein